MVAWAENLLVEERRKHKTSHHWSSHYNHGRHVYAEFSFSIIVARRILSVSALRNRLGLKNILSENGSRAIDPRTLD